MYSSHCLNTYVTVALLETGPAEENRKKFFEYNIKLRPVSQLPTPNILNSQSRVQYDRTDTFAYEINLFNLLSMAKKPKIFLKDLTKVACSYTRWPSSTTSTSERPP